MKTPSDYIHAINNADLSQWIVKTPVHEAKKMSVRLRNKILLKREDLQPVFSFKIRGATYKMLTLTDAEKKQGIITASAGNHAQGVALASQKLGIEAWIVMPKTTPSIKVKSVQGFGAHTVLCGDSYDEAYQHALELQREKNLIFVHPYDDPGVIIGQGTVAKEILEQVKTPIDAVFIPVGGGGLLAGMSVYLRQMAPGVRIIGVEPEEAACMKAALEGKSRVMLDKVGLFADGVAVRQAGEEPFRLCRDHVDEIITVSTDEICAAIKDIFDETRSITEPAGALGLAGVKKYTERENCTHKTFVVVNSGANMNFDKLRYVAERAEIGEHREAVLAVTIPEKPGSFRAFCKTLGKRSITEFNYRYVTDDAAHIFVGLELQKGLDEKKEIINRLTEQDYPVTDLTDNEVAKLHIRYMVGGKAPKMAGEELLFRVEFPERPGALLDFLNALGKEWSITLFHYRNHGAAYGRVLVGFSASADSKPRLFEALDQLGYPYTDETNNPVKHLFL
jgi:threonine dehydratase